MYIFVKKKYLMVHTLKVIQNFWPWASSHFAEASATYLFEAGILLLPLLQLTAIGGTFLIKQ